MPAAEAALVASVPVVLTAACGCIAWTVKILWRLDHRLTRVEQRLGLDQERL